jgi:hypothetical protein
MHFFCLGWMGMENSELIVTKKHSQAEKVGKHKYELQRGADR